MSITGANSADYSSYFTSDSASYSVFNTGSGSSQVVKLGIPQNASVSPTSASYDKYTASAGLSFTLSSGTYNLAAIKNGSAALVSGADYTASGDVFTINQSYLNAQAAGSLTITFEMSGGTNPAAVITVADSTPISIAPATSFTKGAAPANETINVGTAGSAPASGHFGSLEISSNGAAFTAVPSANYDVTYGSIHIALHQDWLNTLAAGTHTLRVNLSGAYAGRSLVTTITVTSAPAPTPSGGGRANPSTGV